MKIMLRMNDWGRVNTIPSRRARLLGILLLFIVHHSLFSQPGTWQSHVSYRSAQSVAVVGSKVYAATQNGFFFYDETSGETTTLSRTNGLSDVGISRLLYLTEQKRLLIAYRNGNLDLLTVTDAGEPGEVKNINTIVTATNLPPTRTITHINRVNDLAYLSTNFGLVVLDIVNDEIRDTYFTSPEIVIYATAVANDSLYALTSPPDSTSSYGFQYRLRAVRLAPNVNIAAPNNWRAVPEPDVFMRSLVANQGRLYVSVDNKGIYERQGGKWVLTQPLANRIIRLFPSAGGLIVATEQAVTLPNTTTFAGPLLTDPVEVVADENQVWVADPQSSLLAGRSGSFERIAPEGPTSDQFSYLYAYSQTLVASPTVASAGLPVELYSVPNSRWQGFTIPNYQDVGFTAAAYLRTEQRLYLGGRGLWSQTEGQQPAPVTLSATINPSLLINNLATDLDGNLWIVPETNGRQALLHVRRADGTFETFSVTGLAGIRQVVPDDNGFLWLISTGNDLVVYDPKRNEIRSFNITPQALVKDRTGVIWIGTSTGPLVFDSPADAFDTRFVPLAPTLNRRRLLGNESITAIAVDGGNRKWLGTTSGLYQVAPDGSQLINTFTAANSPLPDNNVQALAVEPVSGRVFILTGAPGNTNNLVSYGGSATEPAETLTNLTIFPNPVRPDFSGTVSINGLTENSTVKILDAGGQLTYETRSQGGTATWNLRDYRGRSAQTGVYLVVVVSADGTQGLAGKLAVVR